MATYPFLEAKLFSKEHIYYLTGFWPKSEKTVFFELSLFSYPTTPYRSLGKNFFRTQRQAKAIFLFHVVAALNDQN